MNRLTRFEHDGLELFINTETGESFASIRAMARMADKSESTIRKWVSKGAYQDEIMQAQIPTNGGIQGARLLKESLIFKCALKYNLDLAGKLGQAGTRVFLHKLAGYKIISEAVESDREKLERDLAPKPSAKLIDDMATIFGKRFGKLYEQRYLYQQVKKHYPQLAGHHPEPQEVASLPTPKALLTPTEIAEQLGWNYKTGNPNPRRVNNLLAQLKYQEKIGKQWSATDKAIAANLCDRKPVETNSRTQKDQLLWSDKIIDILKEHSIVN